MDSNIQYVTSKAIILTKEQYELLGKILINSVVNSSIENSERTYCHSIFNSNAYDTDIINDIEKALLTIEPDFYYNLCRCINTLTDMNNHIQESNEDEAETPDE